MDGVPVGGDDPPGHGVRAPGEGGGDHDLPPPLSGLDLPLVDALAVDVEDPHRSEGHLHRLRELEVDGRRRALHRGLGRRVGAQQHGVGRGRTGRRHHEGQDQGGAGHNPGDAGGERGAHGGHCRTRGASPPGHPTPRGLRPPGTPR